MAGNMIQSVYIKNEETSGKRLFFFMFYIEERRNVIFITGK